MILITIQTKDNFLNSILLKKIDRFFGFLFILFILPLIPLQKIVKIFLHKLKKDNDKLAILKLLGGGSVLIALPSIIEIKNKFPDKKIILICFNDVAIFVKNMDLFDEIIIIDKKNIFTLIISILQNFHNIFYCYKLINLEIYSTLSMIFCSILMPKELISLSTSQNYWWVSFLSDKTIFYNLHRPIFFAYNSISKLLETKKIIFTNACNLYTKSINRLNKTRLIKNIENLKSYDVIAPFCSDIYKERELSFEHLTKIILDRKKQNNFLLIGTSKEKIKADCFIKYFFKINKDKININFINLAGSTTFEECLQVINNSKTFIGIDSGLLYVSRLLNKRIISFWGPSDPSLRVEHMRPYEKFYYSQTSCSPCVHLFDTPPCNGNNICMIRHYKETQENIIFI